MWMVQWLGPEQLGEVEIGDIRFFSNSVCLNTQFWRRSLVLGRGMLVARIEEVDMTGLPVARILDDHKTHPVTSWKASKSRISKPNFDNSKPEKHLC